MDQNTWGQVRTLAWLVVGLAVVLILAAIGALYMVIERLPNVFEEKTTIIMGITSSFAMGIGVMVGSVGGAFVALTTSRRNVSVKEAEGKNND